MSEIPELFLRIRARHGHYCPMSTLGGRLGQAALQALTTGDGSILSACYRIDTCAADGIALATGCLPENGRLSVCNEGRHCLDLWDDAAGRGVRAELTSIALERAAACRRFQDEGPESAAAEALAALRSDPAVELVRLSPLAQRWSDHA